jgi:folate-binding protein YgfZ
METMQTTSVPRVEVIQAARQEAVWYDVGAVGVVTARGKDRVDLLHRLTTNDLTGLHQGNGKQTVLLTEKARIIDVLTVLQDAEQSLLLTDASTSAEVTSWLRKYTIMDDARFTDVSAAWQRLDVVGPHSGEAVYQLLDVDVRTFAMCQWTTTQHESPLTIVRLPSVCDLGYAIIGSPEAIAALRAPLRMQDALLEASESDFEYLRICAGMGRHGAEFTDANNPLEAGLLHLTSFSKGCYIGQEVVARLDSYNKVKQRVMGVTAPHLSVGSLLMADGEQVGIITSVSPDCMSTGMIGLAYVRSAHAIDGASLQAATSQPPAANRQLPTTIHQLPMNLPCP